MDSTSVLDCAEQDVYHSRHLGAEAALSAPTISALFFSAPYPGEQKFSGHPTGLLYALSVLADRKARVHGKKAAHQQLPVWVPDGEAAFEHELENQIRARKPKIVGISTFSVSYANAISAMKIIKAIAPETVVIFGGAHEDNYVDHYNRAGRVDADFVVAGDGMFLLDELFKLTEEHPFASVDDLKDLVACLQARFHHIPGAGVLLFNHRGDLRKIYTKNAVPEMSGVPLALDKIPVMPRYLLQREDDLSRGFSAFPGEKTAQVMLGQGCPYSCPFCSEAIKQLWYEKGAPRSLQPLRDLSHVEKELEALHAAGYSAIFFDDSTLFAKPKPYMATLGRMLAGRGFLWGGQTTQASVHANASMLGSLADAGLHYLYMGIEHFDGALIDTFGKKVGAGNKFGRHSFRQTLELLRDHQIKTAISLTFGHPDPNHPNHATRETSSSVRYAIDQAAKLADDFSHTVTGVSLNLITYHPGTVISRQYEQKGLGEIDFTGHPNASEPFTYFEEGIGPHAPGMTGELVHEIWQYARQTLGANLYL